MGQAWGQSGGHCHLGECSEANVYLEMSVNWGFCPPGVHGVFLNNKILLYVTSAFGFLDTCLSLSFWGLNAPPHGCTVGFFKKTICEVLLNDRHPRAGGAGGTEGICVLYESCSLLVQLQGPRSVASVPGASVSSPVTRENNRVAGVFHGPGHGAAARSWREVIICTRDTRGKMAKLSKNVSVHI